MDRGQFSNLYENIHEDMAGFPSDEAGREEEISPDEGDAQSSADRMEGLMPDEAFRTFQEAGVEIVRALEEEGFEPEEITAYLTDKLLAEPVGEEGEEELLEPGAGEEEELGEPEEEEEIPRPRESKTRRPHRRVREAEVEGEVGEEDLEDLSDQVGKWITTAPLEQIAQVYDELTPGENLREYLEQVFFEDFDLQSVVSAIRTLSSSEDMKGEEELPPRPRESKNRRPRRKSK